MDDFPGRFFQATSHELMTMQALQSFEMYVGRRKPHHEAHGNELAGGVTPLYMDLAEMEALFLALAGIDELPDMLCPLLKDLHLTLEDHEIVVPLGEHGDPNMN